MPEPLLENRDYTLIVAKTAPSVDVPPPGFNNSWRAAHDAIIALAEQCEEFDPDGITIYVSSKGHPETFRRYQKVNSTELRQVFDENYPPESLNLLDGLKVCLGDYFARKSAGQTKPNGEIVIVLIDGEPRDRMAIVHTIVDTTQQMERQDELGIGFAQVGNDLIARGFLASLDTDLQAHAGARFDIVKTQLLEEISSHSLKDFLLKIVGQ
jgi:hypothetical protein